jgi:hypothetical protein
MDVCRLPKDDKVVVGVASSFFFLTVKEDGGGLNGGMYTGKLKEVENVFTASSFNFFAVDSSLSNSDSLITSFNNATLLNKLNII